MTWWGSWGLVVVICLLVTAAGGLALWDLDNPRQAGCAVITDE